MRKIEKSPNVPNTLQHAATPQNVNEVSEAIYKAYDVRTQLMKDQYSKCAYCECRVTKQYNDVEHYRPKSIYYWLGHNWSNLLYACDLCNRTYKKKSFPLADESTRGDIEHENPLIINPSTEEPLNHITFNRYMVVPRVHDGIEDAKGRKTIDLFQLNNRVKRPTLVNDREQLYEDFQKMIKQKKIAEGAINSGVTGDALQNAQEMLALCNLLINNMLSPSRPFSGMLLDISRQI